ncbi:TetR/AcrR family transcriptional regulator [Sphingorhabdus sp.]|uniref:TetR/AcrR family transcriptional regulator n=1 Tax=Sphingorhabdus sp. TaxID=1902408 RepID=UPI0035934537
MNFDVGCVSLPLESQHFSVFPGSGHVKWSAALIRKGQVTLDRNATLLLKAVMGKKSAAEAAKTRKLIVSTARALFAELGFAGATTSRIAKTAGLTEGAFFHHFKDKKALFAEVVKNLQREFAYEVVLRGREGTNALERFMIGTRASIELSQKPEYLRLVLIEAPTVLGGSNWREIDAITSLSVIEPALAAIAGREDIEIRQIRPMALLTLGLLTETAFALVRSDGTITVDDVIEVLEMSISNWLKRVQPKSEAK